MVDQIEKSYSTILFSLDDYMDRFEISVQKGLSLANLGVELNEAFLEAMSIIDQFIETHNSIDNYLIKEILYNYIIEFLKHLEERVGQITLN